MATKSPTNVAGEIPQHAERAIALAAKLYTNARRRRSRHERALDRERSGMVSDASGKKTLTTLMDRAFRSKESGTTAELMTRALKERGIPGYFSRFERLGLRIFLILASWLPWLFVPIVKTVMRRKTMEVILPGEFRKMLRHVRTRNRAGVRLTINHLGEMILGEHEADAKTRNDVELLALPEVDCLSVKASNLYSQVSSLGFDRSVQMMVERLRPRLRAAKASQPYKLVNLDMEEYRDMAITIAAFQQVLDEPEFMDLQVGLAIQAYIPDSYGAVVDLLDWAKDRVARGGAPIRVRVVKGANRSMELVESSIKGIECPTYDDKVDTDANWKALVELIARSENIAVCHLGIATHNIFDLCWAAILVKDRGVEGSCYYEMLEGMANHVNREVQREIGDVLLYAPVVTAEKFLTAIAYLMRRFDELTDPVNFLSHIFGITPESPEWVRLTQGFLASIERLGTLSQERRRHQDRNRPHETPPLPLTLEDFRNEPDTDWSDPANRQWLKTEVLGRAARRRQVLTLLRLTDTALVPPATRKYREVCDRSDPTMPIAVIELASAEDLDTALTAATKATAHWSQVSTDERQRLLAKAADQYRQNRAGLMALAALNVGKSFDQSDGEISEAIDFGILYPFSAHYFERVLPNVKFGPIGNGVVVVVSPWNFPMAIPSGGVFAALAAGNVVILKPSSESALATTSVAECFWNAGIPRDVLQVVNCGREVASELVKDPRVDAVIFTGGTETADSIMMARPNRPLFAETGGKNVTIVTGKADRELAIKHITESFRFNGQKCSATSLLLLTPELYSDAEFLAQLRDAVASLPVGPAWDPASIITPLFRKPGADLMRAFTTLEEGESWLLEPKQQNDRDDFWSPGIKIGTQRGGYTHQTEFFGPVLAVMRVADLPEALAVVKETGYGLTLGVESLDAREIEYVVKHAESGVVYCNRSTVGAVVQRQTFGGWKDSRRGPGIHAGSPNYVTNFLSCSEAEGPSGDPVVNDVSDAELASVPNASQCLAAAKLARRLLDVEPRPQYDRTSVAIRSLLDQWVNYFSREHRPGQKIRGEDNIHRFRPLGEVIVRVTPTDDEASVLTRIVAASIAGNDVIVSLDLEVPLAQSSWFFLPEIRELVTDWRNETEDELAEGLALADAVCLRYADPKAVPEAIWQAAAHNGRVYVSCKPVLRTGRLELLQYLQEQTVSVTYHRYGGNLRDEDREI